MILPIRTSVRPTRTPYVNYAIIVANAIIFFLQFYIDPVTGNLALRPWVKQFMLVPAHPQLRQFIGYAFLHGGFWHIFFNMFFLYLFGNNVNARIGHIGYLFFYLASAVFSGIGHTVLHSASPIPTIGASGAVAAITGAYLVLFPRTLITVIYWFIFIGMFEVPAMYFIAFKLILIDNIIVRTSHSIAYDAHLAGYGFGIASILFLLVTGLLASNSFDLWAMIKQWNRRRRYYSAISNGYDPFTGRGVRRIKVKEVKKPAISKQAEKIAQLRNEINRRIAQRNLSAAAQVYLELMDVDSNQILPRRELLDIANQLASEQRTAQAAHAYEQFLAHYSNYEYIEQVELMLGILYARYLNQPEKAIKHLQAAAEKLSDPNQLKMCKDELERLQKR